MTPVVELWSEALLELELRSGEAPPGHHRADLPHSELRVLQVDDQVPQSPVEGGGADQRTAARSHLEMGLVWTG